MKFVVFNVENLYIAPFHEELLSENELDKELYQKHEKPQHQLKQLAQVIKEIDGDVYYLCEIGGPGSLERFNHLYLDDSYIPFCLRGNSQRGIDVGYLVKKGLPYELEHISNKEMPIDFLYPLEQWENENALKKGKAKLHESLKFSRDISELRMLKDGRPYIINLLVHLKSKLDSDGVDPLGVERRRAELLSLEKHIRKLEKEFPDVPIFIGGDFNTTLYGPEASYEGKQFLEKLHDYHDVLEYLKVDELERLTFFRFKFDRRFQDQLDYFMVADKYKGKILKKSGVYTYKPFPNTYQQWKELASDHYPLICDIEIN